MKIDRLVSIILILLDKERVGAQELAERFEVSRRTIYRDIDAINLAGIPVRAMSGVGGGFEIMEKYKIDKNFFSTADLSAILTGLTGLSGMMQGDELASALAKIKSFIPADKAKEIEFKANQISIDLSPWIGHQNLQSNLEAIKAALQESKLLSFEYTDRHGNKTHRTAEPYQLVLKGGHWYWHGYCLQRNDFRLFKLSRISNLQMKEDSFVPREHQKPQLDYEAALTAMQTRIKIRIHRSVVDRILDYCSYEDLSPDGEEHYFIRFPFIENDYYYSILLSFGDRCECLEPPHIRAEVKRRIQAFAQIYDLQSTV